MQCNKRKSQIKPDTITDTVFHYGLHRVYYASIMDMYTFTLSHASDISNRISRLYISPMKHMEHKRKDLL